ncbi:carbohydrate ABC transporter permease [Acetivibrio thermocellus]|uniref:carbohydrate ABC transporter permease n=1 Tax=Acetivibrio thermocellus TaxID=1515 RepID=UPI0001C146AE|nr:carbohydrate ABC transporter permease [Acetivibrio thermocellus]NLU28002.1 carbohydrate ABC transporter permease [Acetivibrio thermocellus]THJ77034.1 carbohydrate ABC transporter permease [Acetivibrio thermocellus]UWV48149.1 carbohydrate ABC transporter permease [Acetivibrio thermocellus]
MAKIGYFESMKRKKKIKDTIANIILAILVVLTLGPIVFMVLTSLMDHNAIARGKWIAPTRFSNYVEVFQKLPFGIYFRNSLIVCSIVMVVALVIATLAGYSLAKYKFPGSGFFGILILATQLLPGMMFLLPLYLDFVKIKQATGIQLINSIPGLVIVYSAFFVPFSIWIIRGFFASIPGELEEAARIDGCNKFTAFLRVMLPLAVPGIVATAIYIFLTAWDELIFAWVLLKDTKVTTIPAGIRGFIAYTTARYDLLMAAGTIVTIPVLIMFFTMQKRFISGMTAGAVKG